MAALRRSAASAYRRHDSGFGSLEKNGPSDFQLQVGGVYSYSRSGKEVIECSSSVVCSCTGDCECEGMCNKTADNIGTDAPSEAHTEPSEFPEHVVDTCPGTATDVNNPMEEVDYETLETGAIRKFYSDLCKVISQEVDIVSTELYSCKLIERTKLDQILELTGNSNYPKAAMVLNTVLTKLESAPSRRMFDDFIQILEKCGVQEIAEQIRASYDKQLRQHKQRPSPIGCSDIELMSPSLVGKSPASFLSSTVPAKTQYRRETSHPSPRTSKRYEHDTQDDVIVHHQVRQLNIEVLKLQGEKRKLEKKVKEQKYIIDKIENDYQELLARNRNLEMQNHFLRQQSLSLLSLTDDDTDCPRTLCTLLGWTGCQSCYLKGNTQCKESTV